MHKYSSKKRTSICIITSPRPPAGVNPVSNLSKIILFSNKLYLITGNNGNEVLKNNKEINGVSIVYNSQKNILFRAFNYMYLNMRISLEIIKVSRNTDFFIFFMSEGLFLPIVIVKLLRKPSILSLAASAPKISSSKVKVHSIERSLILFEYINYFFADLLVLYSPRLIGEWGLGKYQDKIMIAHEHFLDFSKFNIQKKLEERECLIGYIGRLSDEKGVFNFVKAIPELLCKQPKLKFIIGGSGILQEPIETFLNSNKLDDKVKLVGWISHSKLPDYLNKLKLLVLPSYTEGLPNIVLEAMACGTPVLATSVGSIPDIIIDEKTGFILKDNSPETITKNVMKAIDSPNIEQIVFNARSLVENKFTFQVAVNKYKEVFNKMS